MATDVMMPLAVDLDAEVASVSGEVDALFAGLLRLPGDGRDRL